MNQLTQIVSTPVGTFAVLALAAYPEVQGDACFQSGLYHASGMRRFGWFLAGAAVLVCYSLLLNFSKIDFGKLLGVYVVLFFLVAQIIAKFAISSIAGEADLPRRSLYHRWRIDHDSLETPMTAF